jgi:acetylglutamate kinase
LDKNNGDVLNVNADTIAKELAVNLKASKLVFISDVPYVQNHDGSRISIINDQIASDLISKEIIKEGMVVKVENSLDAVNRGVDKIHIISGQIKDALLTELETEDGIGTVFQSKNLDY